MAETTAPPPHAFVQGVGTVFQFAGVMLFLALMTLCCASSLLYPQTAVRPDLTRVGWRLWAAGGDELAYSAQRAMSLCMAAGLVFGMAAAGAGLGLQALRPRAAFGAAGVAVAATVFWLTHAVFFGQVLGSAWLSGGCAVLAIIFGGLAALAIAAVRDVLRDPPRPDSDVLPADYKPPHSHLHEDPPEVRLARELQQRRERLRVQQKELEAMERRLKRKLDEK